MTAEDAARPALLTEGVAVRLVGFTATHNRLSLRQDLGSHQAEIELCMCHVIQVQPDWIAGKVAVSRHGEYDIRVSDGVLDVICEEAQRWHKWESDERPVLSLRRHALA